MIFESFVYILINDINLPIMEFFKNVHFVEEVPKLLPDHRWRRLRKKNYTKTIERFVVTIFILRMTI